MKPEIAKRQTRKRGRLEPVTEAFEVIERKPTIPRDRLGTIPKGFTYADVLDLIDSIGLEAWQTLGYNGRLIALRGKQ